MKYIIKVSIIFGGLLALPCIAFAQTNAPDPSESPTDQLPLLPRIYASDVTITSPISNHAITGTFIIRNSEKTSVGNIQYEIMLLGPLESTPTGQIVGDTAHTYDRIRPTDIINLKANEQQTIPFSYQAPNVPQGPYRIRIQIITTNDRKLGWDDASITLGGANTFIIVQPQSVNVESSDPITKEHNTTWDPLYGVNVDPNQKMSFSAILQNPENTVATGIIQISTKRLLYANEKPIITHGATISVPPNSSKPIEIPIVTQKKPSAYIILVTLTDPSGNKISGVGEYRYVVRGESASVASIQLESIPATENGEAVVDFVLGGSADRNTPVKGTMNISITDNTGTVGSIDQSFTAQSASPVVGSAHIAIQRTVCGTPTVAIKLTNASGSTLDQYSVEASAFANPSCKKPFLSFITLPVINTGIAIIAILLLGSLYRIRTAKRS